MRRTVIVLAMTALFFSGCDRRRSSDDYDGIKRPKGILDEDPPKCRSKTVLNQQIVVEAGAWQSHPFVVKDQNCSVTVRVTGVRDTGKGFTVHVMPGGEPEKFKAHQEAHEIPTLSGLNVMAYDLSEDLPAGPYAVLVQNSNNIMNSMVVNVTVSTSPR